MWIIIVDLRENNGHVIALLDDEDNIAQYDTFEEAEDVFRNHYLSDHFSAKFVNMDE